MDSNQPNYVLCTGLDPGPRVLAKNFWVKERQEREPDQSRTLNLENNRDKDRTSTWDIFIKLITLHDDLKSLISIVGTYLCQCCGQYILRNFLN